MEETEKKPLLKYKHRIFIEGLSVEDNKYNPYELLEFFLHHGTYGTSLRTIRLRGKEQCEASRNRSLLDTAIVLKTYFPKMTEAQIFRTLTTYFVVRNYNSLLRMSKDTSIKASRGSIIFLCPDINRMVISESRNSRNSSHNSTYYGFLSKWIERYYNKIPYSELEILDRMGIKLPWSTSNEYYDKLDIPSIKKVFKFLDLDVDEINQALEALKDI